MTLTSCSGGLVQRFCNRTLTTGSPVLDVVVGHGVDAQ